jgi:hypothetical protein
MLRNITEKLELIGVDMWKIGWVSTDSCVSGWRAVLGSCERCKQLSSVVERCEFLD